MFTEKNDRNTSFDDYNRSVMEAARKVKEKGKPVTKGNVIDQMAEEADRRTRSTRKPGKGKGNPSGPEFR